MVNIGELHTPFSVLMNKNIYKTQQITLSHQNFSFSNNTFITPTTGYLSELVNCIKLIWC